MKMPYDFDDENITRDDIWNGKKVHSTIGTRLGAILDLTEHDSPCYSTLEHRIRHVSMQFRVSTVKLNHCISSSSCLTNISDDDTGQDYTGEWRFEVSWHSHISRSYLFFGEPTLQLEDEVIRFNVVLSQLLKVPEEEKKSVVAVHCHYGFNRTGYMLCW